MIRYDIIGKANNHNTNHKWPFRHDQFHYIVHPDCRIKLVQIHFNTRHMITPAEKFNNNSDKNYQNR